MALLLMLHTLILSSLLIAHLSISDVVSTTFTITNKCNYTVWPGILSNAGVSPLSTTGFTLQRNESKIVTAPASWGGRIWGRTYCNRNSSTGDFSCLTGDCGSGKLECSGGGAVPPATLAEFKFDGYGGLDFFDVSVVDGFNLPLLVEPKGGSGRNCTSAGCVVDLNSACPSELRIDGTNGESVGCKSACDISSSELFCCSGRHGTPETCKSTVYSRFFKAACPRAYSYAYDDQNSTYMCTAGADYQITFCPEIMSETAARRKLAPIIVGLTSGGLVIISLVVILVLRIRRQRKSKTIDEEDVEDEDDHIKLVPGMPVRFSYEDLRIATNDFKERLGRGGFGSVFKGVLTDGTEIAVKRLGTLRHGKSTFLAEVETIGSLHHFNLVRLIGFCAEKSHRLLVYEYMSNGSLDKWIFKGDQTSNCLDWQTRKKIILDIAKGLAYLHEDCRHTIMHLDIKPQNILLDQNFNAKISDFGLSKLIDRDMGQVQIPMRGTPGYLAPEWHQTLGRITVKVDTYSFGIVLLEVVFARRNADSSQPESAFVLLGMLQKKAEQDRLTEIVENLDDEHMQSHGDEVIKMIKIGAWCLQDDPERRPLMSTVVKVLEGTMEVDSNIVYKFSHSMIYSPPVANHISSAPLLASVLSNPR